MLIRSFAFVSLCLLTSGCGSSLSPSGNLASQTLSITPRQSIHEGELARDPSLRADLSRQQLITYLESSSAGAFDTGSIGQDQLPFYCAQPLQLRIKTAAPHLAGARILDAQGKVLAAWGQGTQEVSLPAGDYRLELTSSGQQDAHVFLRSQTPPNIRPLTDSSPGVYLTELSETPQVILAFPQSALIGASSDGSTQVGAFGSEADFHYNVPNPGSNLSLAVHQYFANGGSNLEVATSASSSVTDLSNALGQLPENTSYQLALADLYQLPAEQADPLAETALAWTTPNNSLLFLDIPATVTTVPLAVSWRQQRPQLASSQCLLYWPGLTLSNSQEVGSSSSVLGLLDALQSHLGPGTAPQGQTLQGASNLSALYSLAEIPTLGSAQINPVYPDLSVVPAILLVPQPGIPDLSAQQKLLTITQSIRIFMQSYVFSPNNANTWQTITQGVSATLLDLYQQGVLAGSNPGGAFQFDCGIPLTMTGGDVLNGYLILVGRVLLAPNLPSVVLNFTQTMQDS